MRSKAPKPRTTRKCPKLALTKVVKSKSICPLEHDEQVRVIEWADIQPYDGGRVGDYLWAVPNGGKRNRVTAALLKAEGVRAGVPDLQLGIPCGGYHGLFIEMKRARRSLTTVSRDQRLWHARLNEQGYCVVVCYGADEAIKVIQNYLKLNEPQGRPLQ